MALDSFLMKGKVKVVFNWKKSFQGNVCFKVGETSSHLKADGKNPVERGGEELRRERAADDQSQGAEDAAVGRPGFHGNKHIYKENKSEVSVAGKFRGKKIK